MKRLAILFFAFLITQNLYAAGTGKLVNTDKIIKLAKQLLSTHKNVKTEDLKAGLVTTRSHAGKDRLLQVEVQLIRLSSKKEIANTNQQAKKAYSYKSYIIQFDAYKLKETPLIIEGDAISYDY